MQRISVTVGLNGSTLQFEEQAYRRLELYLAEASRALDGNPDQQEILADLEQAVADQCSRRMGPQQSVVTLAELEPALDEIGPVQSPGAAASSAPPPAGSARALQQVSEGAVVSGVCQGLARYFGLDVTLLRIFAVLLVFLSGGGMILVYLALMLLLPYAPLQPGGPPVRKIPAKCREWVEFLRAKLNLATS
jgi:phage shock protein PspC (stress-responsive transcriptional regulator)